MSHDKQPLHITDQVIKQAVEFAKGYTAQINAVETDSLDSHSLSLVKLFEHKTLDQKLATMKQFIRLQTTDRRSNRSVNPEEFLGISSDYYLDEPQNNERFDQKFRHYIYMGDGDGSDIYEAVNIYKGGVKNRETFEQILRFDTDGNAQRVLLSHWKPPVVENSVDLESVLDEMAEVWDLYFDSLNHSIETGRARVSARKNETNLAKRTLNWMQYNDVPLLKKK